MNKSKNQVQETPQQRALVELATAQVADYKSRWLLVQKRLAEQITTDGAEGSSARQRAKAVAGLETGVRFTQARDKMETALGQTGQLGSSKGKLSMVGLATDKATAQGLGTTQAEQDIDSAYTAGLASLMALGRGEKATAVQGLARSADMSARRAAADADASLSARMGDAQLGGQVAGLGLSYSMRPQTQRGGITGTNDFQGVTGDNAMDKFFQYGTSGG